VEAGKSGVKDLLARRINFGGKEKMEP